jgi:hypothetical protein
VGLRDEARGRYEEACERRSLLVDEWVAAGRPFLTFGGATGKAEVMHPLVKALNEADALCDRLAKAVGVRHRGPQASDVPGDLPETVEELSPAARLRAVK